jgi:leucine dehydrogenase
VRWGTDDLAGKRVALQGCGNVGYHLACELAQAGASLTVADVNQAAVTRVVEELHASAADASQIHALDVDIFAPCALGGVLNADTIPELRCALVAGAANNQLLVPADAALLDSRGILYIPDFIANAGGVINGTRELLGWPAAQAAVKVDAIYQTTLEVCRMAKEEGIHTAAAADRLAESRISREV